MKSSKKKSEKKVIYKYLLVLWTFVTIVSVVISVFTMIKSFTPEKVKSINYSESSNINYRVYLKENNFYENEYLEGNSIYVASLIDKININFDYIFKIDEKSTLDFEYSIVAKLIVSDESGKNNYYEKNYTLLKNKNAKLDNLDNIIIKENIDIDYDYYNDIVNEFRSTYGLNIDSRLEVRMLISKINGESLKLPAENTNSDMSFSIPLSEKAVNIKVDYKELEENSYVIKEANIIISDIKLFVLSCICILITIYAIIKWIIVLKKIIKRKTKFEKIINKILKEYDRLIVEASNLPKYDDYDIININEFLELVDVHDNLNLPIVYYLKKDINKAYFYIMNQNTIYLYIVDSAELGETKDEKK